MGPDPEHWMGPDPEHWMGPNPEHWTHAAGFPHWLHFHKFINISWKWKDEKKGIVEKH